MEPVTEAPRSAVDLQKAVLDVRMTAPCLETITKNKLSFGTRCGCSDWQLAQHRRPLRVACGSSSLVSFKLGDPCSS